MKVQAINRWMNYLRQLTTHHASNETSINEELIFTMNDFIQYIDNPNHTGRLGAEPRAIFTTFRATLAGWVQMIENETDDDSKSQHGPMGNWARIEDKFTDPWPVINRLVDIVHKIQFDNKLLFIA